jgi:hypothetical protein
MVTGDGPVDALGVFLKGERRKLWRAVAKKERDDKGEGQEASRRSHWYCRSHLWTLALRECEPVRTGVVNSLDELKPEELKPLLERSSRISSQNTRQRESNGLERGAGPHNTWEWQNEPEVREYNGKGGGCHFRWHAPWVFSNESCESWASTGILATSGKP